VRLEEALLQHIGVETEVAGEVLVPAAAFRMAAHHHAVAIEDQDRHAELLEAAA
jgi:hypothetical protein